MSTPKTFASLFDPAPEQWSLRGDPLLWQDMQSQCKARLLPATPEELRHEIGSLFLSLTGHQLGEQDSFHVAKYDDGVGMSAGFIHPVFRRETAVPLLLRKFRASMDEKGMARLSRYFSKQ